MRLIPRIHLSTAIILSLVAGALMALNSAKSSGLVTNPTDQIFEYINLTILNMLQRNCDSYGWPFKSVHIDSSTKSVFLIEYGYIAWDLLLGIVFLGMVGFLCEFLPPKFSRKQIPS